MTVNCRSEPSDLWLATYQLFNFQILNCNSQLATCKQSSINITCPHAIHSLNTIISQSKSNQTIPISLRNYRKQKTKLYSMTCRTIKIIIIYIFHLILFIFLFIFQTHFFSSTISSVLVFIQWIVCQLIMHNNKSIMINNNSDSFDVNTSMSFRCETVWNSMKRNSI